MPEPANKNVEAAYLCEQSVETSVNLPVNSLESRHPERSRAQSKDPRLSFDRSSKPSSDPPQLRILLYDQPLPQMKPPTRAQTLYHHFFRRFFDNDTVSIDGETQTTVIRALAFVAVPTFMFAFWLLPAYPGNPPRPLRLFEADRYFFVLFSLVSMGAVTTFEWEMLFPDRPDFLILLTLPLKARELFYAKGRALLAFLGMFLIAANLFSGILFPAVSTRSTGNIFHTIAAHLAAVLLAGIFSSFTILAVEGLILCLLPSSWFRTVSTAMQCLAITVLLLLFLLYPLVTSHITLLLAGQSAFAQFLPPLWFLGIYETLMQPNSAPAAAWPLAQLGLYSTAAVTALALLTYPLAWSRQKKRALEGSSQARKQTGSRIAALLHRTLLPRPQQRAIFHFISQTIARNPRYQVYLANYSGAGLALAICSVLTVRQAADHTLTPALWTPGLHAVLPLLLFWMVVGLRASFAFPVDMRARWVFPININLSLPTLSLTPGTYPGPAAKSAKTWVLICCAILTAAIWSLLLALHWPWINLAIQALCGAGLSILLTDLFFLGRTQIPFTRPRLPGRASLPLVFTLYAALFPAMVLLVVQLELTAEKRLADLAWIALGIPALHLILKKTDKLAQQGIIGGFPEDETDEGPQTLGLTQ
jgi:hypothetical protein